MRFSVGTVLLFLFVTAIIAFDGAQRREALPAAKLDAAAEHILVIDPGHGGLDGGASAGDGTAESAINLQIALRMEALAKLTGVKCRLTRRTEALDYPAELDTVHEKKVWDQNTRVTIINNTPGAVLFSVHQNRFPDPRPSGTEVLYAKTPGSRELAELTHEKLTACLCPENRRVAAPAGESIYLMKQVGCPAILVECGFLSNYEEARRLESAEYQKLVAAVLIASYFEYIQSDTL